MRRSGGGWSRPMQMIAQSTARWLDSVSGGGGWGERDERSRARDGTIFKFLRAVTPRECVRTGQAKRTQADASERRRTQAESTRETMGMELSRLVQTRRLGGKSVEQYPYHNYRRRASLCRPKPGKTCQELWSRDRSGILIIKGHRSPGGPLLPRIGDNSLCRIVPAFLVSARQLKQVWL